MRFSKLALFVVVVAIPLSTVAAAREWIDRTGRHYVEAELIGLSDGAVSLKKVDGTVVLLSSYPGEARVRGARSDACLAAGPSADGKQETSEKAHRKCRTCDYGRPFRSVLAQSPSRRLAADN